MRTILGILLAVAPALFGQSAYLVKDINTATSDSTRSSFPDRFFRHGSRIYFAAYTQQTGVELFSTDGTEAGTSMVADVYNGPPSSDPKLFASVNGNLLFNAYSTQGEELWTTDGTRAGTRILADINDGGFESSSPADRIVIGGNMLFSADDGVHGRELWITDGTTAGTRLFKEFTAGPEGSFPRGFVPFNGAVYFGAGNALWKTDGTEGGTVFVTAIVAPNRLAVAGTRLYFSAYTPESGSEPWVSDGTASGTHRLADITPGPDDSTSLVTAIALGNRLLFTATDHVHGGEWWITDGTPGGTQMLVDANPGPGNGAGSTVVVNGGTAYFVALDANLTSHLWKTDGTPGGTTKVFDGTTPTNSIGNLVALNGLAYFTFASQMWRTDGSAAGTVPVITFTGRGLVDNVENIDGTLYLSIETPLYGWEPWKSDGTAAGTVMIANIERDAAPSSGPDGFKVAGDLLYFNAWDGITRGNAGPGERSTLWRTDGTPEGTLMLAEKAAFGYSPGTLGRTVFFQRTDQSLWTSDGTPEGTQQRFSPPWFQLLHMLGDKLLVSSNLKLKATTTAPGAALVDLDSPAGTGFVSVAGRAFYITRSPDVLWSTDGTLAGTYVVTAFSANLDSGPVVMGGSIYLTTRSGATGTLWRSDGHAAGTSAVATLPEAGTQLVAAGNRVFFVDRNDGNLWTSDGTAEGTRELPGKPYAGAMAAIGNSVVFGHLEVTGTRLWISDGTVEGTRRLHDISAGATDSGIGEPTSAAGLVYFRANAQGNGHELWVTDGTAAGTRLAADVEPGSESSYPTQLTAGNGRLYFRAATTAMGGELWAIPFAAGPRLRVGDVRVGEGEANLRFTVSLSSPATQNVSVEYVTANGTAAAGSDYDAASGTLSFAVGESSKTFDVRVHGDAALENDETVFVTLRNASGATIESGTAAGIIEDDDVTADAGLLLDLSTLSGGVSVDMTNAGPGTASNLRAVLTATPSNFGVRQCDDCRRRQLAPGAKSRAFFYSEVNAQQYITATVSARERDPNPANNTVGWTQHGTMAMDALSIAPGGQANVWFSHFTPLTVTLETSDPTVLTVPPTLTLTKSNQAVSFVAHAGAAGTATIYAIAPSGILETLVVNVVVPGTAQRWPGGVDVFLPALLMPITSPAEIRIKAAGTAPFNGATATGVVTVTADGQPVGQLTLSPQTTGGTIEVPLADVGPRSVTVSYGGDANFLPIAQTYNLTVFKGQASILATAVRTGTDVVVTLQLSGSPAATPTGIVRVGTGGGPDIPLTPVGPGRARAEVTLHGVPASTVFLPIYYSGDTRYEQNSTAQVRIREERSRAVRH